MHTDANNLEFSIFAGLFICIKRNPNVIHRYDVIYLFVSKFKC